nr:MAG TPA: hypothetical protein [Caudoviricetes sp.]
MILSPIVIVVTSFCVSERIISLIMRKVNLFKRLWYQKIF